MENQSKPKSSPFLLSLILLIVSALTVAGIYVFSQVLPLKNIQDNPPKSISTPSTSPLPSSSPEVSFEISIAVKNGSGISGQAAEIKQSLEGAGFTKVTTSNTDETLDVTKLELSPDINESTKQILLTTLKTLFDRVDESPTASSSAFKAIIITGKNGLTK